MSERAVFSIEYQGKRKPPPAEHGRFKYEVQVGALLPGDIFAWWNWTAQKEEYCLIVYQDERDNVTHVLADTEINVCYFNAGTKVRFIRKCRSLAFR